VASLAIPLHGPRASLDPRKGEPSAIVAIPAEVTVHLDRERNRARLDSIPGTDLDRWVSGPGLLLLGRLGWWEVELVEDNLPDPEAVPGPPWPGSWPAFRRPCLPRDLASCPWCRRLVVVRKVGTGLGLVTPTTRLARRARALMRAAGLMPFVADQAGGHGRKANRPHSLDCFSLPLFRPFAAPTPRKTRAMRRKINWGVTP
jgi:hypothetical protein